MGCRGLVGLFAAFSRDPKAVPNNAALTPLRTRFPSVAQVDAVVGRSLVGQGVEDRVGCVGAGYAWPTQRSLPTTSPSPCFMPSSGTT
jgi:hypothetical protein